MKDLKKYKVILWDFDGVILDSMPIRTLGFRNVLENYPKEKVDNLIEFHEKNGGWSRYAKFRYFFENILKEDLSNEILEDLSDKFSKIMLKLLSRKELLIEDSLSYIKNNFNLQQMHIVSGSDQIELRILCQRLHLSQYFKSINGSPTPKIQLVRNLLDDLRTHPSEIVLIGDSKNDLEAANYNNIEFMGYNNLDLLFENQYIHSFC